MICPTTSPLSLRVSVTDLCQFRCRYCLPPEGVAKRPHEDILRFEEIARFAAVAASHFGLTKIHLTGGEPLLRRDIIALVRMLASQGTAPIAMTTNGKLLAHHAADLKSAALARVNVSLDSLNADTFQTLTAGGRLAEVLEGIEEACRQGLQPVKLNMVVLRGINDHEVASIARWGLRRHCRVRYLELMPIGPGALDHDRRFVPMQEVQARLAAEFEMTPMAGEPHGTTRQCLARDGRGAEGVIGFIAPQSHPFCSTCRRIRLTASGRLVGCLGIGKGPDVRAILRDGGANMERRLIDAIDEALSLKRRDRLFTTPNLMIQTGG